MLFEIKDSYLKQENWMMDRITSLTHRRIHPTVYVLTHCFKFPNCEILFVVDDLAL